MKFGKIIETDRLVLRDYIRSDLSFVTNMWFDKENGKYLSDPAEEYVDQTYVAALDGMEESPYGYYFIVELKKSHEPVGSCCIFTKSDADDSFDIGYCVLKAFWRQGFGSEIVSAIINVAKALGGKSVTAEVATDNVASNNLLNKKGFTVIDKSKFKKYNMDVVYDSNIYYLELN